MAFGVPGQTEDSSSPSPAADRRRVVAELGAHPAGLRIPDQHGPVVAGRSNLQAVGAERHAADFSAVLGEGKGFLAALVPPERGPIPDANGPVGASRSEAVALRAERHALAPGGVTTQDEDLPTGRRVPDAHRLVFAARSKAPAVRADRNAFHLIS